MTGANVRIGVTADTRDAVREFGKVGDAAEKSGRSLDDAAEHAGNMASTSSQVAGGLGDLGGAISALPGPLGAVGTGMEVAAPAIMGVTGAADLAEVVMGKLKLGLIAQKVAMVASTAATAAQTVATWALNGAIAVLTSPITLVVAAIALFVAGVVLLYNKNETFRNFVNTAWAAIKTVISKVGSWIKDTLWPWIRDAVDNIKTKFQQFWDKVIAVKDGITTAVGNIKSTVQGIADKVRDVVANVRDKIDTMVSKFDGIKGRLSFGGMFDGIKSAFRSALNWIIGKWNGLSFSIPSVDTHIPGVGKVGGFSIGTPNIPLMDTGGIVRGPGLVAVGNITEAMIPLSGAHAVKRGMGGNTYKITVVAPVGASPADIGRELTKHIDAYERAGGRRRAL
jgi:uncharacterized protein YoxC